MAALLAGPAALHRDVVAAQLQPWLASLPVGARGAGQVLPILAEADGPVGPGLTLALTYGLGARDPVDRAAAVDALLILASRHQLDGPVLGRELAALMALDLLQLGRIVPALRDAARSGATAEVWAAVATAIPGMVPPAVPRPPRGLPDLLALGRRGRGRHRQPQTDPRAGSHHPPWWLEPTAHRVPPPATAAGLTGMVAAMGQRPRLSRGR